MTTNLNKVSEGFNKYCVPAALSVITGRRVDECTAAISRVTGVPTYKIKAVYHNDALKALELLGFTSKEFEPSRSLFATIVKYSNCDGIYMVSLKTHMVVIEINEKQVFFCDNHTKEPMNATASARLSQEVMQMHRVWKKPDFKEVVRKEVITTKTIKLELEDICRFLGIDKLQVTRASHHNIELGQEDMFGMIEIQMETKTYE